MKIGAYQELLTICSAVPSCGVHISFANFHTLGSRNPTDNPFQVPKSVELKVRCSRISAIVRTSAELLAMGPTLSKKSVIEYVPVVSRAPVVTLRE